MTEVSSPVASKPTTVQKNASSTIGKEKTKNPQSRIKEINDQVTGKLADLQKLRDGKRCYPFLLYNTGITPKVVEDTFDELCANYGDCDGYLDVLVFSGGGDIDAAYNLALLFRRYAANDLTFIVNRWAKSAATLLVCGGNKVLMSPIAELGPLDPQITEFNPMEKRMEQFSPLHMEATLDLIRDEFEKGNEKLANGLLGRLQFPLTLGSFKKTLNISEDYAMRLLSSRMLIGQEAKAREIAHQLTFGYANHGFCIEVEEARKIGLKVDALDNDTLAIVWSIHKLCREKEEIKAKAKRKEMEKLIRDLPPELLENSSNRNKTNNDDQQMKECTNASND